MAVIRTPDQRLRVFVSSTIGELAEERRAVSRAISALRLTPVLFEQGARAHPPRELYQAYLAQSDVFIGLYWQVYGLVGPGMEVSGLEEELELSRGLPRLLYIKRPAPDREPRLTEMLGRVRAEAADSYRYFSTARELGRLVRDDLATLLSERFAAARPPPPGRSPRPLPASTTSLVGRERAIDEIAERLGGGGGRLLTLTGPSGVGKTRLAVAVGDRLSERFDSGTLFVPLEGVNEAELVPMAIGRALGAELGGMDSPQEALIEQLGDGRWLLILDNLEQVLDVARDLDELLSRCPGLAIMATSLTPLRLRAEREYPVPPLPLPSDPAGVPVDELAASPGVALFLDRARAVRPDLTLTEGNAAAVVEICRRLEGLPLAIELAAARTRLLDPDALLQRLARSLDALGSGTVNMPARHHTLRATVEWSVGLLDVAERSLLETVAVFVDGWTVEAAADVAGLDEDRALDMTEELARHSLLRLDDTERGPRPRMLETVREFVAERLRARPDLAEVERRHADHYRALAEQADRPLRGLGQGAWFERLQADAGNLGAAVRWYLAHDTGPLPHVFRVLWPFWFLGDHMDESRAWVNRLRPAAVSLSPRARAELEWTALVVALDVGDDEAALAARERLEPLLQQVQDPFLHAVSQLAAAWTSPIAGDFDGAIRSASAALDSLRGQEEPFWTAMTLGSLGSLEMFAGREDDALPHLIEARALAGRFDHTWLASWTRTILGGLATMRGRLDEARTLLDDALRLSVAARSTANVTLCLVAFARWFLVDGEPERAALALGAAEGLRGRVGLRAWPMLRRPQAELAEQIREALGSDRFDERFGAGSRLSQREAVAAVRDGSSLPDSRSAHE